MDTVTASKPILERFRLQGKTSLVTGAGQGIGRAYAHALGEAGAAVAVVDLLPDAAQAVAKELAAKGIKARAIVADITRQDQVQRMVDEVIAEWGALTIAVNNAGIGQWVSAEDVTHEIWERIMRCNLDAVLWCAQAEAKAMRAKNYGKITASMSGTIVNTPQNQLPYNVSKAGVLHLTRSLAAEWARYGIRVNSISPGYTMTKLVEDLLATPAGRAMKDHWLPLIPMGRMADVTDLQGAVVYLASEASDYMTGADLLIDGGYCVW
ncbi:MAG: glucose 1-dehydrogenase [Spirochaetes bacterium]|nr:glucose 1-dehydrogenase [Spirochaetota bacterium]